MDEGQRTDVLRRAAEDVQRTATEHGWSSPQVRAAQERRLALERSTAAELGLPFAEPVDLGVRWDTGAPMPVLVSGLRTFVAYYLSSHDPVYLQADQRGWDPRGDHGVGVVEFRAVTSVKMGSPNDEVLDGHPLWGSGLEYYRAHEVRNSPWIRELADVNRVHAQFRESHWDGVRHFVLTFHDETLECAARETIARIEPTATMSEVVTSLITQALG